LLEGQAGGTRSEVTVGRLVLHQVGPPGLGGRVGRVGPDADRGAQFLVTVDDLVAGTTLDRVTARAAEQDVTLAPDRARERAPAGGRQRRRLGCGTEPRGARRPPSVDTLDRCHTTC